MVFPGAFACGIVLAATVGLAGCSSDSSPSLGGAHSAGSEGGSSHGSNADKQHFDLGIRSTLSCPAPPELDGGRAVASVKNTSGIPVTVHVSDADGRLLQSLEKVGNAGERSWTLRLPDGDFHLQCVFDGKTAISGDMFHVKHSNVPPGNPLAPITKNDLATAAQTLNANERPAVDEWVRLDDALLSALNGADRAGAQSAWKAAYLQFRSLADVAEEWPDPAGEIGDFGNTTATGSSGNPNQPPEITGYHRIEWGLWHNEPLSELAALAATHNSNVHKVAEASTDFYLYPSDYGLRVHEVTEELERNDLRERTDFGSHTTASTVRAGITATRSALAPIRALLSDHGHDLSPLDRQLDATDSLAAQLAQKYDGSVPFSHWDPTDRRALTSNIARQNELLAPIATTTIARRF